MTECNDFFLGSEKDFGNPKFLLIVGSLGLIVFVVLTAVFVVLCYKLNKLLGRRRKGPVRLMSNNDFNFRVSDVLDGRKSQMITPRKSRHVSYFRQESYEATHFDRTIPYGCRTDHINDTSVLSTMPIQDNQQNENGVVSDIIDDVGNKLAPMVYRSKTLPIAEIDEHTDLANTNTMPTCVLPKDLKNNEYQVPTVFNARRGNSSRNHYQTPVSHYQTPKCPALSSGVIYHTPKTPRKVVQI